MQIEKLILRSFRLFEEREVDFMPGINVISGQNATGKTTLLEGIYLLMAGRSFRTPEMRDLIQSGLSQFFVDTCFEKNGVKQSLKMSLNGKERGIFHNSTSLPNLRSLLGLLQGVLLAPHDIDLVKGAPSIRRHYLDLQMAQVDPLLVGHFFRYAKGLKSRNALLKSRQLEAIEGFEESMAVSASYILKQRASLTLELEGLLQEVYHEISGRKEPISLHYRSSLGTVFTPEALIEKWATHRKREVEMGCTLMGPHRDDLKIQIYDREIKTFASEGEMRTMAAAMRLAEWQRMRKRVQEPPMLLIDDFGISLDPLRASSFAGIVKRLGQVIITQASDHQVFGKEAHIVSPLS